MPNAFCISLKTEKLYLNPVSVNVQMDLIWEERIVKWVKSYEQNYYT